VGDRTDSLCFRRYIPFSLLDIGPTAEGEIIAPMMNNLLDAGAWLDYAGNCVYDTVRRQKGLEVCLINTTAGILVPGLAGFNPSDRNGASPIHYDTHNLLRRRFFAARGR
jgi:hypothetical protein